MDIRFQGGLVPPRLGKSTAAENVLVTATAGRWLCAFASRRIQTGLALSIHRSKCQRTEFSGNLLISEVVSGSLLGYFLEYFLGFNFFTFNSGFYSPSESSFSLKSIEN